MFSIWEAETMPSPSGRYGPGRTREHVHSPAHDDAHAGPGARASLVLYWSTARRMRVRGIHRHLDQVNSIGGSPRYGR